MSEIEVYRPRAELAPATAMERAADFTTWAPKLAGAATIAREICQTDFVPAPLRGKPAAVAAAIMAGAEMNLGPMASLMHVHIVEGRPSLSAEMQRALVLSLGHRIRYREMTTTRCIVDGQRRGDAEWTTVEWSMDDAKRAGLDGRQNWRRYPRRMLAARATGELCRLLFSDALAGMPYSAEELEDDADDTAAATGAAPAEAPKPRTAQRAKARNPSPPPAQAAPPPPAVPPSPDRQGSAGGALPPLPGEDEPGPGPSGEPDPVTNRQLTAIWTMLTQEFAFASDEKEQARAVCGAIVRREITSTTELTKAEGMTIIDALGNLMSLAQAHNGSPREHLLALMAAAENEGEVPGGDE